MNFTERMSMPQPSVKIWVPDKAIAPEAHNVLHKAATNRRLQDGLNRIAQDFELTSLDIVVTVNDEPEDGVDDNKILFLFRQENPTGFDQVEILERARSLLGRDVSITWYTVSPNTPERRIQQADEYAAEANSTCKYDSERDRGRGGIAGGDASDL